MNIKQIVYADIIFLLNFCMDFLALFAAGKISNSKQSPVRLVLASAFGALYCIFTFMYDAPVVPDLIINIAVSVLMCFIAYNIKSFLTFTKIFLVFYLACFMLGGGIEALYHLSGLIETDGYGGEEIRVSVPIFAMVVTASVCVVIFLFASRLFKLRSAVKESEIIIGFKGNEVKFKTLVDSGNLLYDPISSLPVIIINVNTLAKLLNAELVGMFLNNYIDYVPKAYNGANKEEFKSLKFRLIPLTSIGGSGLLPAFIPDYIKIPDERKKTFRETRAAVAVNDSKNAVYGENCGGIAPTVIFEN